MPTVAQKLCNDIVEPILKSSKTQNNIFSNEKKTFNNKNGKAVPSPYSQRSKVITKNQLSSCNTSNGLQNEDILLKFYKNAAINTEISGQLKCNNDCVTLVRKRDNHVLCKCNNNKRLNFKLRSKEIQTINKRDCSLIDKSCTHFVETVSCGTQIFDHHNSIIKRNFSQSRPKPNVRIKLEESNQNLSKLCIDNTKYYKTLIEDNNIQEKQIKNYPRLISRPVKKRYWAVSHNHARGPDF